MQDISGILNRLGEVGLMGLSLGWIRIVLIIKEKKNIERMAPLMSLSPKRSLSLHGVDNQNFNNKRKSSILLFDLC